MRRLLILTSAAAMIGMAAPAYADDPPSASDADFITQLKAAGVTLGDPAKAIAVAKNMCSLADSGTPDTEIESHLVSLNPGLTAKGADKFMALSAAAYCPKYEAKYLTGQGWTTKPPSTEPAGPEGKPPGTEPAGPEGKPPGTEPAGAEGKPPSTEPPATEPPGPEGKPPGS